MAIEGLMIKQSTPHQQLFRPGQPDVSEAVGVTMEAYKLLGYAGDPEYAEKGLTSAFEERAGLGYDGRLYVPVPTVVSYNTLLGVAEGKRPEGVNPVNTSSPLWVPSAGTEGYTEDELNQGPAEAIARLALFNADTDTGFDPLLHHLDIPFDDYAQENWGGETTQLAAVAADTIAFEAKHAGLTIDTIDHREFALLALMDRIRGEKPDSPLDPSSEEFILNRGLLRVAGALGRRTVRGVSLVGYVDSIDGQLRLGRSGGFARSNFGLGVSMGPKQLELQAS